MNPKVLCFDAGRLAVLALCEEARTAPKPGLVDPYHPGAHRDMDYALFLRSATCLESYFQTCFLEGLKFAGNDPGGLFEALRTLGRDAEKKMYTVTCGVNTHKGAIFSMGLLTAAAGLWHASGSRSSSGSPADDPAGEICRVAGEISSGIVERDLRRPSGGTAGISESRMTAGESLFRTMGVKGVRGEAENGFPVLRTRVLPVLRQTGRPGECARHRGFFGRIPRHVRLDALLSSISSLEDSCIIARGGLDGLDKVRRGAIEILDAGGSGAPNGERILADFDRFCCDTNLSPGGSADMLAAGLFLLYYIEMRVQIG